MRCPARWSDSARCRRGGCPIVAEDHGLQDLEVADRTGRLVDVDLKALHSRLVMQRSAAGAAVRQSPPVLALGVVVDVRKVTETPVVGVRSTADVECVAIERKSIDELWCGDRTRERCNTGKYQCGHDQSIGRFSGWRGVVVRTLSGLDDDLVTACLPGRVHRRSSCLLLCVITRHFSNTWRSAKYCPTRP